MTQLEPRSEARELAQHGVLPSLAGGGVICTVMESQEGKPCLNLVKKGSWKPRVLLWNCETPAPTILPRWIMGPSGPGIHQD
jgi:hypothetical protein